MVEVSVVVNPDVKRVPSCMQCTRHGHKPQCHGQGKFRAFLKISINFWGYLVSSPPPLPLRIHAPTESEKTFKISGQNLSLVLSRPFIDSLSQIPPHSGQNPDSLPFSTYMISPLPPGWPHPFHCSLSSHCSRDAVVLPVPSRAKCPPSLGLLSCSLCLSASYPR